MFVFSPPFPLSSVAISSAQLLTSLLFSFLLFCICEAIMAFVALVAVVPAPIAHAVARPAMCAFASMHIHVCCNCRYVRHACTWYKR